LPIDIFHPCYDYCKDDIFLNRYQETGTETYFDTATYSIDLPTTLSEGTYPDQNTHKLNLEYAASSDTTSTNNQVESKLPSVDYVASFDPFLLNDQSSLSSPSDATFCLPCNESSPTSNDISAFVNSFDILSQSRLLSTLLPSISISESYTLLLQSDPRYAVILLEARQLQLNLSNYDERVAMPMHEPAVYHSNETDELPIVIDTGASCSLTPIHSDFIGTIDPSNVPTLNNISGKTPVVGQGRIEWNIQDVNGVVKPIQTTAYYVPQATIRLFSPQVYIAEDKSNTSEMVLTKDRVSFILACGNRLTFPINRGSNLPIMLIEAALNRGKKGMFTSSHIQDQTSFQPSANRVNLQLPTDQLTVYQTTILDKSLLC
jgi:hypothetical protein